MLKICERHVVTIDGNEVGCIELDINKQHYVFTSEYDLSLTWSDIYEIQCKLSDLNENYIPF